MLAILLEWRITGGEHRGHLAGLSRGKLSSRAKVDKNCTVILYQHDVFRLDVAVNHVCLMHHTKSTCHLLNNLHEKPLFERSGFFNHLEQRLALEKFHHHIGGVILFKQCEHFYNTWVLKLGQTLTLLQELVSLLVELTNCDATAWVNCGSPAQTALGLRKELFE